MKLKQRFALASFVAAWALALSPLQAPRAAAQNQSYEGIEGFVDYKHRGPVLTINPFYFNASTSEAKSAGGPFSRILADAYIPNTDYEEYPIRFDFFINRELVSSQLRSPAQPGAIALTLPASEIAPPFTYSVIATLLYPNRSFSTVINGTLTPNNPTPVPTGTPSPSSLSKCTLTLTNTGGSTTTNYEATTITGGEVSDNSTTISFTATEVTTNSTSSTVPTSLALDISGDTGSGDLSTTVSGKTTTTAVDGPVSVSNNAVASLSLESDGATTKLVCD